MVTFLVCLMVVGGAMAAILVVTMDGAADQPATGGAERDRRDRLRSLSTRAAGYLVPAGGPPTTSRAIGTRLAMAGPATQAPPDVEDDLPTPVDGVVEAQLDAADLEEPVVEPPEPPEGPEGPEVHGPPPVAAPVRHETSAMAPATSMSAATRVREAPPEPQRRETATTGAAAPPAAPERPQEPRQPAGRQLDLPWSTTGVTRTVSQRPLPASRGRRALRRMRGAVVLVVLLLGLGTVLALSLAGLGALLAIGVRAAVGT